MSEEEKEKRPQKKKYGSELGKVVIKAAICGAVFALGEFTVRLALSELSGSDRIKFWVKGKRMPVPAKREHARFLSWLWPFSWMFNFKEEKSGDGDEVDS